MQRVVNISERFFPHICLVLLKVIDNNKLEMQPFFLLFVMTFIRVVIASVYTRPSVCKSSISKITCCCHYQKKERHEEGNSQITDDKTLVAEFLRRSEKSYELL